MAASTKIPAKALLAQVDGSAPIDFDTDTIKVLIAVAGAGAPDVSKTGTQFVTGFLAANAETTGTGYARQTLASKTLAFGAGDDVDFGHAVITFLANASGFTANASAGRGPYLMYFKDTGADATSPVFAVCDLAQNISSVGGDVTFTAPAGGLIQWTKSP